MSAVEENIQCQLSLFDKLVKSEFITQILAIFLKKYHNKTIEALGESADTWKGARI